MKGKIIYVDFIKKRRVTFIHFIINRILILLLTKLNLKNTPPKNMDSIRIKRIFN